MKNLICVISIISSILLSLNTFACSSQKCENSNNNCIDTISDHLSEHQKSKKQPKAMLRLEKQKEEPALTEKSAQTDSKTRQFGRRGRTAMSRERIEK